MRSIKYRVVQNKKVLGYVETDPHFNGGAFFQLDNALPDDERFLECSPGSGTIFPQFREEEPLGKKEYYQFTGFKDKSGQDVYEGDVVKFQGKEYPIKYFPKWGMFGLSGSSCYKKDDPEDPAGSGGSSTRYRPYCLGPYYQARILIVGNLYE